MTTVADSNDTTTNRVDWWHSTFAEPCSSGPAEPDDALCAAHGLMVVPAGTNGWPTTCYYEFRGVGR